MAVKLLIFGISAITLLALIETGSAASINWASISAKLPTQNTPAAKAKRKTLFNQFDNGNGVLSLAEIDKAMRDVLKLDVLFAAKPAVMRAFQLAKNVVPSKRGKTGDDFVELLEFKFFLTSLRQYFEYFVAFGRVDTNADKRIDLKEFTAGKAMIEKWVGKINDVNAEFKTIDKNNGGFILFDEFSAWATTKKLDLEDDDN